MKSVGRLKKSRNFHVFIWCNHAENHYNDAPSFVTDVFSFSCTVHKGNLDILVKRGDGHFDVMVEMPDFPCVDDIAVSHTAYTPMFQNPHEITKRVYDHWIIFSELKYWTYHDFSIVITCGDSHGAFYEALDMVPGGKNGQ